MIEPIVSKASFNRGAVTVTGQCYHVDTSQSLLPWRPRTESL